MKLNRTHLKLLIALFILLDAVARVFLKANSITYQLFKGLGNCAVGLLCFLLADGYYRSTNKKKYAIRMLILAVVCYIPFNIYENPWIMIGYGNAFRLYFPFPFNLFISILMLMGLEKIDKENYSDIAKKLLRLICFMITIVLSIFCAYPIYTQMMVLNYSYNKEDNKLQICSHLLIMVLILVSNFQLYNSANSNIWMSLFYCSNTLGYLLCIPLKNMYSGCAGNKTINRLFYLFYPIVLIVSIIILKNTLL